MLGYLSKFRIVKKPVFYRNGVAFSTKPTSFMEKPATGLTKSTSAVTVSNIKKSEIASAEELKLNKLNSLAAFKPKEISPYEVVPVTTGFDENSVSLPGASVCPEGFPLNVYTSLCRAATVLDCLEKNLPLESIAISSLFVHTQPGSGIKLTEFLFNNTALFELVQTQYKRKFLIDCKNLLPDKVLCSLADHLQYKLSMISLKKELTVFLEIWAMTEVNRHLTHSRLGLAYENDLPGVKELSFQKYSPFRYEKDLYYWRNHYDNTSNNHPDYVLVMDSSVNLRDHPERVSEMFPDRGFHPRNLVAYDLKLGQLEPSINIIKSCYDDQHLAGQLIKVQRAFMYHLKAKLSSFDPEDKDIAVIFGNALNDNLNYYNATKDLSMFHANYNGFQETYSSFLLRNEIGFNFLIKQSIADLHLPQKDISYFSDQFKKYYSTPGTTVSNFAKRIAEQNTSVVTPNETIKAFVLQSLKK